MQLRGTVLALANCWNVLQKSDALHSTIGQETYKSISLSIDLNIYNHIVKKHL